MKARQWCWALVYLGSALAVGCSLAALAVIICTLEPMASFGGPRLKHQRMEHIRAQCLFEYPRRWPSVMLGAWVVAELIG